MSSNNKNHDRLGCDLNSKYSELHWFKVLKEPTFISGDKPRFKKMENYHAILKNRRVLLEKLGRNRGTLKYPQ